MMPQRAMSGLAYIEWLRGKPCIVCGHTGVPHHLKAVGMGRNRKRDLPEHWTAVPLCQKHHTEVHAMGKKKFENRYNTNLQSHCDRWVQRYKETECSHL